MRIRQLLLIALLLCLVHGSLAAEPAPPSSQPDQPQQRKDQDGDADKKEPFVDRDGDGIQDGKEHRFRRRRGKDRGPDGDQRRIRRREGPGNEGREGEPGKGSSAGR
jgi:hypothetical protein